MHRRPLLALGCSDILLPRATKKGGEKERGRERCAPLLHARFDFVLEFFLFFTGLYYTLGFYTKLEKKKFNAFVRMTDKFRSFACYKSKY